MLSAILLITLYLISCVDATCVSLAGICYGVSQYTMQFNINRWGTPTHEDVVSSYFNENLCGRKRYSTLFHNTMECQSQESKGHFHCTTRTDSVWLKVFDSSDQMVKQFLSKCNKNLLDKYINIDKLSCVVDGMDPFTEERKQVGKIEQRDIYVDDQHYPNYEGYYPDPTECVWNYEIDGIWSSLVITVVTAISIVLILFIVLFAYSQYHRKEQRTSLNRTARVNLLPSVESEL